MRRNRGEGSSFFDVLVGLVDGGLLGGVEALPVLLLGEVDDFVVRHPVEVTERDVDVGRTAVHPHVFRIVDGDVPVAVKDKYALDACVLSYLLVAVVDHPHARLAESLRSRHGLARVLDASA